MELIFKNKKIKLGGLALLLGLLAALFFFLGSWWQYAHLPKTNEDSMNEIRANNFGPNNYKFINPLLGCTVNSDKNEFVPLKSQINALINAKIMNGDAKSVSIYFDTRDGRWFGINTDEAYSPASMMKVPEMIAVLKKSESSPELLKKEILYDGSFDLNGLEFFKPKEKILPHHRYTVDELLHYMMVYSDNNAVPLLDTVITDNDFRQTISDLGVFLPPAGSPSPNDFVSVKAYSNFFRVLYNASYLNRDNSEKALKFLTEPDFPSGIEAGLPKGTINATKFGERNYDQSNPNFSKELHDCGIIYSPHQNYLMCIMTKGDDFIRLAATIRDITKSVYDYINSNQ